MLSSFSVVPAGTGSLTVVIASLVPVFVILMPYVTSDPSLNSVASPSSVTIVFSVSITGLATSGVSFPSTTAVFKISFSVFSTITVKETVTELFLATSTTHEILPFSIVADSMLETEFSFNFVPAGTTSDMLTFVASIFSLWFVTVISYVISLSS